MRAALPILAALAVAAPASALASSDAASAKPPSAAQVRAAVRTAERSKTTWATVNICNTRRYHHTIGIRGQIPALGFPAVLSMIVRVEYWAGHRFVRDPGVKKTVVLGTFSRGLHQGGYTFRFAPPVRLAGQVTFRWQTDGKVVGTTTRTTRGGIKTVDYADPHGFSAATCRISH